MIKKTLAGIAFLATGACAAPVQNVAERYVKLALAIGQHDPNYVDAYYGPAAWREAARRNRRDLGALRVEVAAALEDLRGSPDAGEALRVAFLRKQLASMLTRIDVLSGKKLGFDEETASLYDAVAPHYDRAHYQQLVDEIAALLPGEQPLPERIKAFRAKVTIPRDKLERVLDAGIQACRERSAEFIALPANESFVMEFVTDKPWSGYNWYQGNAQSLIQINVEFPIYIDRAVDLGCHEGYPGHHVYNALLEVSLVRARKWIEFSIYPLYSPMSLIAEGSANYGIEMAFSDDERLAFERDVLFPMAGLDPALAAPYRQLRRLFRKLSYADNDAAMHYLNGDWTREETLEWLMNVQLHPPEKAAQRISFYEANRGYVINYNVGEELVRQYVQRHVTATDPAQARAQRWAVFKELLSSPRLASDLE